MIDGPFAAHTHSAYPFPKASSAASGKIHQKSPPGSQIRTSISFLMLPVERAVEPTARSTSYDIGHAHTTIMSPS
jgi:hypothetical protein